MVGPDLRAGMDPEDPNHVFHDETVPQACEIQIMQTEKCAGC
jgi:hypothetical protein